VGSSPQREFRVGEKNGRGIYKKSLLRDHERKRFDKREKFAYGKKMTLFTAPEEKIENKFPEWARPIIRIMLIPYFILLAVLLPFILVMILLWTILESAFSPKADHTEKKLWPWIF
jgi:multidrug efflux pump subunit AcrB